MKTIVAVAAVLALASPIAALAQVPGHMTSGHVTRTVVTHEATRSGPVVTRTTVSRPLVRPAFQRVVVRHHHRIHPIVRKQVVYSHGGRTVTTTTITRR